MYTLVVVDVQDYFITKRMVNVVDNCIREIKTAMQKRASVIFLEYKNCGATTNRLSRLVKRYDKAFFNIKNQNDGSNQVLSLIASHRLASKRIKVVGINTDACVQCTVEGLLDKLDDARIAVVADACDSVYNHIDGLNAMRRLKNVRILNEN